MTYAVEIECEASGRWRAALRGVDGAVVYAETRVAACNKLFFVAMNLARDRLEQRREQLDTRAIGEACQRAKEAT